MLSLVSEGIDCDEASNGDDALSLLNEHVYDLVLTDIEMPVLSGLELLKVIRSRLGLGNLKVLDLFRSIESKRNGSNDVCRRLMIIWLNRSASFQSQAG